MMLFAKLTSGSVFSRKIVHFDEWRVTISKTLDIQYVLKTGLQQINL